MSEENGRPVKFSPDGLWVANTSRSGVTLWNTLDGSVVELINQHFDATRISLSGVEFTPGGHLVIPCEDRLVLLKPGRPFDVVAGTPLVRWPQQKRSNTWFAHAWSPDRELYARCTCMHAPSHDVMCVTVYRSDTLEMLSCHELEGHVSGPRVGRGDSPLAFSHDNCRLLCIQTPGPESICWIWDTLGPAATALPPRKLIINYVIVHSTFNPVDSTQLFVASKEGVIEVRDVASGSVLARSSPSHTLYHPRIGVHVDPWQYSSDGRYAILGKTLYILGQGPDIVIYDLLTEGLVCHHISFSPDGTRLVVIGRGISHNEAGILWKRDECATHWECFTFVVTHNPDDRMNPFVNCASFSPDSRFLAIGSSDGTIQLWNMDDVTRLVIFTEHTSIPYVVTYKHTALNLAFSTDGRILCSAVKDGKVCFHRLHGILPN